MWRIIASQTSNDLRETANSTRHLRVIPLRPIVLLASTVGTFGKATPMGTISYGNANQFIKNQHYQPSVGLRLVSSPARGGYAGPATVGQRLSGVPPRSNRARLAVCVRTFGLSFRRLLVRMHIQGTVALAPSSQAAGKFSCTTWGPAS